MMVHGILCAISHIILKKYHMLYTIYDVAYATYPNYMLVSRIRVYVVFWTRRGGTLLWDPAFPTVDDVNLA